MTHTVVKLSVISRTFEKFSRAFSDVSWVYHYLPSLKLGLIFWIVVHYQTFLRILVWLWIMSSKTTKKASWNMTNNGADFVFNFFKIGSNFGKDFNCRHKEKYLKASSRSWFWLKTQIYHASLQKKSVRHSIPHPWIGVNIM